MNRPAIAIVGPGKVGSALAKHLARAGYRISQIISRDSGASSAKARHLAKAVRARSSALNAASLDASIVWFCVPDSEISKAAAQLAHLNWRGKVAFHSSGVVTSDALRNLGAKGAAIASVHPLMTFASASTPDLRGSVFGVEGDKLAIKKAAKIVRALGGDVLRVRKQDKPAYHAFATLICPMLVSLLATAERIATRRGMPEKKVRRGLMAIVGQTANNYATLGPAASFTGPIVRGDVETVRQHLRALRSNPDAWEVYIYLARAALENLPSKNRSAVRDLLNRFNPQRTRRNLKHIGRANKRSARQS
jgi:predicted short-subunit dehydrogenase-like oxidoreductase (DUF2520 family)